MLDRPRQVFENGGLVPDEGEGGAWEEAQSQSQIVCTHLRAYRFLNNHNWKIKYQNSKPI